MSMGDLKNAILGQAQLANGTRAATRMGTVSSYNPADYTVKVKLQPDDTETGWLPLAALGVGQGWGMIFAPGIGDQIEVQFQEGDAETPIACGRFFNDVDRPMSVPSGEFWLVHKSGGFIKTTNDGKASINGQAEVDVTAPTIMIQATGNVNVMAGGQANVTAPVINLGAAGAALLNILNSAFATLFNSHTHKSNGTAVQTDPPLQQAGAAHMTSTVKAS
ncbi:phage baseplate assembly protein V [Herbaspirillum sp. WKF16]|uniref:phage baseplate assembly protein V n=1 Tax=Herbaspirillum sp. WKF16 TaxID=3028312 RepID=UPI0023A9A095|nr:phage baseplate assembly protein V [Herbaspirillum sp. WKF16]WDZ97991.1 phage baseplate assembly protein V [Herbaspirillum sp. WKF16]